MNRLPPALPGRWLDGLLPGEPNTRPGQQPGWRFATATAKPPATAAQVPPRPPVRTLCKPPASAHAEPARTVRAVPNPVREQQPEDLGALLACTNGGGDGREGGNGGEGTGQGDAEPMAPGAAPASAGMFDAQDIVAVLPAGDCSGIFEVQLPGGETMAVAVDAGPAAVAYHLKPASKVLAERLRGQQKELSAQLERRIGKDVTLTIL